MTASKAKGTRFESAVVTYLREHGLPGVERRALHGNKDRGDLAGLVGWSCELKDRAAPSYGAWMAEARTQARNAGARWYCVIHKARRAAGITGAIEDAYVVMPLSVFADLLAADSEIGGAA